MSRIKNWTKTLIARIGIRLAYWGGAFHNTSCDAFGGYAVSGEYLRLCKKNRWHTDSHAYEVGPDTRNEHIAPGPKLYVLAANYQHFKTWCQISGIDPTQARYVSSPEILRGIDGRNAIFVYCETWMQHPQATEIANMVDITQLKGEI